MLEATRRNVLDDADADADADANDQDQGTALNRCGLLVPIQPAPIPATPPWVQVESGTEVHFGRTVAQDQGVVDVLGPATNDETLSRRHARLALDDDGAYLVDLGSTNGTWVNGQRLASHVPTRLSSGATFQVGAWRFAWLETALMHAAPGLLVLERDAFEHACLRALVRAQRYERPLALLVLNRVTALAPGDQEDDPLWLAATAPDSVVGKLGPGEWAVLLPEHSLHKAHEVADFLHALAHEYTVLGRASGELCVGVTAVEHDITAEGVERPDAGLALDLDSVKLLIAAAREDCDGEFEARAIWRSGVPARGA